MKWRWRVSQNDEGLRKLSAPPKWIASRCNQEARYNDVISVSRGEREGGGEKRKREKEERAAKWIFLSAALACKRCTSPQPCACRYLATCRKSGRGINDPCLSTKLMPPPFWSCTRNGITLSGGPLEERRQSAKPRNIVPPCLMTR